jgi:GNAT superfamily N-acetyltransferase
MYVKTDHRGNGISKLILSHLEDVSIKPNDKCILLETGIKQAEAISLYKKYSYTNIKCYSKYYEESPCI